MASNHPINVFFASTSYPKDPNDWRGIFIRHLVYALAKRNEIHLKIWAPPGEIPKNIDNHLTPDESIWLNSLMDSGGIANLIRKKNVFSIPDVLKLILMLRKAFSRNLDQIDIYHLNWLQTALPLPNNDRPVIVSALGSDLKLLNIPLTKTFLKYSFKSRRVAICPNAEWMVPKLESIFGHNALINYIPFGVASEWYSINRDIASNEDKNWLTVLRITQKKIGPLFDWGESIFRDRKTHLHLFGPMQENINIPNWVKYHGPVTSYDLIHKWMPKAQGLITLSEHDEGKPQIILEAMAAGLPIIASAIPAHKTIVENEKYGYLCSTKDKFEQAVHNLNENIINLKMGNNARDYIKCQIGTWDDTANKYINLYNELLEKPRL